MAKALGPEAFSYYASLGAERSYQRVADHFGVAKRTVARRAEQEGWSERLATIEREARKKHDEKAAESLDAITQRHLKVVRAIQAKAIETLRQMPLDSAMEAVRALDIAIKQERLILGEPTERNALTTEQVVKREYERWLEGRPSGAEDGESEGDLSGGVARSA